MIAHIGFTLMMLGFAIMFVGLMFDDAETIDRICRIGLAILLVGAVTIGMIAIWGRA